MKLFSLIPLLFIVVSSIANNPESQNFNPPTPAPDFTVTTSDGQVKKLYQDYISQQKLVVIEAFFTTCPPCATHAPLVQNLYTSLQAAHPGKVEFILLSTLFTDTNVKVAQYKINKGLSMPAVGKDGGSITALQPYLDGLFGPFQGTPTFIVIAPGSGAVTFDIRGNTPSQTIALLQEKIESFFPKNCSLQNPFGAALEEVQLKVDAPNFDTTIVTNGNYDLSGITALKNTSYELRPKKYGNTTGLTTYDLVLISKHILAIEPFKCPWQITAADVNCTGSVTTFDIVTARKVILGILDSFPCGAWRFMPDSAIVSNGQCHGFVGVALGDVNAGPCADSLQAPSGERAAPKDLWFVDQMLEAGETALVPFHFGEKNALEGLQLELFFDSEQLNINQIDAENLDGFDPESYRLEPSGLALSWLNPQGQSLTEEADLFTLQLTAVKTGRLSDLLTVSETGLSPEYYGTDGKIYPIQLATQPAFQDFKIVPNPAPGHFKLQTWAEQDADCLVQMIDLQGKIVFEKTYTANKGFNQWEVDAAASGLHFLKVNGRFAGKVVCE